MKLIYMTTEEKIQYLDVKKGNIFDKKKKTDNYLLNLELKMLERMNVTQISKFFYDLQRLQINIQNRLKKLIKINSLRVHKVLNKYSTGGNSLKKLLGGSFLSSTPLPLQNSHPTSLNNTSIDKLSSEKIIEFIEKN